MNNVPCVACDYDPRARTRLICEYWLPTELASGNKLRGNGKGATGWVYRANRAKYLNQLELAIQEQPPVDDYPKRRRCWFTRHYVLPQRPFDDDNLLAGFKPLRDCLKLVELIHDDNQKWLEAHYDQEPGDIGGVSVRIEEFLSNDGS